MNTSVTQPAYNTGPISALAWVIPAQSGQS